MKNSLSKSLMAFGLFFAAAQVFAADPCTDPMGHSGNGTTITRNQTGSINNSPWGFEQWADGGSYSMTYYPNGTFSAKWTNSNDYLARVGFRYGDNGPGVDHNQYHYTVDYKYTKNGLGSYGYIGVYGWTVNPQVEYYIVDDWYSQPSTNYIGDQFGEITVDGAKYTIHAFLRQQEPSKTGTSTFLQIFSVRQTPRQCGHIDISAHFKKWDEIFTGQTAQLKGSKGGGSTQLKFGKVTEVMLMNEAGGNSSGEVDYTYFYMSDSGEGSSEPAVPKDTVPQTPYKGSAAAVPGKIQAEDFDEGYGAFYDQGMEGDTKSNYRSEAATVDINGLADGGYGIGYTNAGEWYEYTVNVAQAGNYELYASAANGSAAASLSFSVDGKDVGTVNVAVTPDDWDSYATYKASGTVNLSAGTHVIRMTIDNSYSNIDWFALMPPGVSPDDPTTALHFNGHIQTSKSFKVYNTNGKYLGQIEIMNGSSVSEMIKTKFRQSGIYMIKSGSQVSAIAVK